MRFLKVDLIDSYRQNSYNNFKNNNKKDTEQNSKDFLLIKLSAKHFKHILYEIKFKHEHFNFILLASMVFFLRGSPIRWQRTPLSESQTIPKDINSSSALTQNIQKNKLFAYILLILKTIL